MRFSTPDFPVYSAVDIGTSKIATLVARINEEGSIELLGTGVVPSGGVRSGAINNVHEASERIRRSIEEAERTSEIRVKSVIVGIAGRDVESKEIRISQGFGERGREILASDIEKLEERARNSLSEEEIALHIEPQQYLIDGRISTENPMGMWGIKLDYHALVITASIAAVNNLKRCVHLAGAEISQFVLEPVASAEAVLDRDERLLGVAVLDMGGGTSDLAIYQRGSLRATVPINMGGEAVTMDLAKVLGAPLGVAEQLKLTYGLSGGHDGETIQVYKIGGDTASDVPIALVNDVIRARMEEILEVAAKALEIKRFREPLAGGIVVTGGTARMTQICELASRHFKVRVRRGEVRDVRGDTDIIHAPEHATGLGLIIRAAASVTNSNDRNVNVRRLWKWIRNRWKDFG